MGCKCDRPLECMTEGQMEPERKFQTISLNEEHQRDFSIINEGKMVGSDILYNIYK